MAYLDVISFQLKDRIDEFDLESENGGPPEKYYADFRVREYTDNIALWDLLKIEYAAGQMTI